MFGSFIIQHYSHTMAGFSGFLHNVHLNILYFNTAMQDKFKEKTDFDKQQ